MRKRSLEIVVIVGNDYSSAHVSPFRKPITAELLEVDLTFGSRRLSKRLRSRSIVSSRGNSSTAVDGPGGETIENIDVEHLLNVDSQKRGCTVEDADASQERLPPKVASDHRGRSRTPVSAPSGSVISKAETYKGAREKGENLAKKEITDLLAKFGSRYPSRRGRMWLWPSSTKWPQNLQP